MNDTILTVNQVVLDKTDDSSFRILYVSNDHCEAYWISLTSNRQIPVPMPFSEVEEGIRSGRYAIIPDSFATRNPHPGETAIKRRDQAWNLISGLVACEPAIYRFRERSSLLKKTSENTGTKVTNIYKYLARYWKCGMTPDALLPFYENCGKGSDPYDGKSKRRGRKKAGGAEGKVLTNEDIRHFTDAILTWYMGSEQLTLEKTYKKMQDAYYVTRDGNGVPVKLDPDLVPSRAQFLYWHRKNRDLLGEAKARDGEKNYPLRSRASIEKTETFLSGPCASSQIDATIADIFLVSQGDRTKIVGRPVMYFLMDSFTRIVLGMHISLESPSWGSATMCILNAMEDKQEFCAKYGVQITHDEWPCHHIPKALVADRGEMESVSADLLVNQLGMRIENTPPYRGDLKGIIERHFHTINIDLAGLPGKTGADFGERCTEDYRLNARLTLNEFISIIIHCVLLYNNYHYMEYYGKTMQMRQMKVKPVPLELWNFGMKYLSGVQRTIDRAAARYALLPSDRASITGHGIQFKGLYYGCDQGFREHWFDSARTVGREAISVSYDPRDTSFIYFKPSHDSAPVECFLLDSNKIHGQLSTGELEQLNKTEHEEREAYRPTEDFQSILTENRIQEIVSNAEALFPDHPDKSAHKRISEIKENRKAETENTSNDTAIDNKPSGTGYPDTSATAKSPIQRMLEEALDELY